MAMVADFWRTASEQRCIISSRAFGPNGIGCCDFVTAVGRSQVSCLDDKFHLALAALEFARLQGLPPIRQAADRKDAVDVPEVRQFGRLLCDFMPGRRSPPLVARHRRQFIAFGLLLLQLADDNLQNRVRAIALQLFQKVRVADVGVAEAAATHAMALRSYLRKRSFSASSSRAWVVVSWLAARMRSCLAAVAST